MWLSDNRYIKRQSKPTLKLNKNNKAFLSVNSVHKPLKSPPEVPGRWYARNDRTVPV